MIKIIDNGEPLVRIDQYCPNISFKPRRKNTTFVRKTIALMLSNALGYLPSGYTFQVWSALRDINHQKELLERQQYQFSKRNPSWSQERVDEEIRKYVAPIDGVEASGHLCGAALDLRLVKNGRVLPMKSKKLTFQENCLSLQPKLPDYIQKNREIMRTALERAGFSNLNEEFWHFSYGDYEWAKKTGNKTAIYGVVGK